MTPAGTDRAVVALGGNALLRRGEPLEAANQEPYPLAGRAGQIGYVLEMQLDDCIDHQDMVAVITRVVGDGDDSAFRSPSKFIGPLYTEVQARQIVQLGAIEQLLDAALIVVCAPGGGVPVATIRVTDAPGMDRWRKRLFVAIWRNAANPVEYFKLPDRRTVTLEWQAPL